MNNGEALGTAALVLVALGTLLAVVWGKSRSRRPGVLHQAGTIGEIYIYPIKSCAGVRVSSAECTTLGLKNGPMRDRTFMVRSDSKDTFVTSTEYPRLVTVVPSFPDDEHMCLDAPGMDTLWISLTEAAKGPVITTFSEGEHQEGYDCGATCLQWFENFIGKPGLRLIYFGEGLKPTNSNSRDIIGHMMRDTDIFVYSNKTSYMLMSSASMKDLNKKLKIPEVPITNFRPNIVVDGTKAFDEDKWDSVQLGNDVQLKVLKLCDRCNAVNVNGETGIRHQSEPLKTLRSHHPCPDENLNKILNKVPPIMGVNAGIDFTGTIRTGDPVYILYKK